MFDSVFQAVELFLSTAQADGAVGGSKQALLVHTHEHSVNQPKVMDDGQTAVEIQQIRSTLDNIFHRNCRLERRSLKKLTFISS